MKYFILVTSRNLFLLFPLILTLQASLNIKIAIRIIKSERSELWSHAINMRSKGEASNKIASWHLSWTLPMSWFFHIRNYCFCVELKLFIVSIVYWKEMIFVLVSLSLWPTIWIFQFSHAKVLKSRPSKV